MGDRERIKELEWQLYRMGNRLEDLTHRVETLIKLFQKLAGENEREAEKAVLPEIASHYEARAQCYSRAAKWLQEDLNKALGERREAVGTVSAAL